MTDVIRRSERTSSFKWNAIPYKYDSSGQGTNEEPPTAWLLGYYLLQYLGLDK